MSWVWNPDAHEHRCVPPKDASFGWPIVERGGLWSCHCGQVWRVGPACDRCEIRRRHRGLCTAPGDAWRPATFWQQLTYFMKGRTR